MHHPSSTRQQAASLCVSPTVPAEEEDAGQKRPRLPQRRPSRAHPSAAKPARTNVVNRITSASALAPSMDPGRTQAGSQRKRGLQRRERGLDREVL